MKYLAQFQLPGGQQVEPPGGIPEPLRGGFDTSGKALIQLGLNWLFIVAAFLALIFIMYSGVQWITSKGDPSRVAAAKARLMYSVIGLVVVAAAFLIVRVIVVVLGGDTNYFFNFGGLGT